MGKPSAGGQFIDSRTAVGVFVILAVAALIVWSFVLSTPKSEGKGVASVVAPKDYSMQSVKTIVRVYTPESIVTKVQVIGEETPTDLPNPPAGDATPAGNG